MAIVYYQAWEESERGWGVKPDGFSLHLTLEDHKRYLEIHNASMPTDYVPNVYERISGDVIEIEAPDEHVNWVVTQTSGSYRFFSNEIPAMIPEFLKGIIQKAILERIDEIEKERGIS